MNETTTDTVFDTAAAHVAEKIKDAVLTAVMANRKPDPISAYLEEIEVSEKDFRQFVDSLGARALAEILKALLEAPSDPTPEQQNKFEKTCIARMAAGLSTAFLVGHRIGTQS